MTIGLGEFFDAIGQCNDAKHALPATMQIDGDAGIPGFLGNQPPGQQSCHANDRDIDQKNRTPPEMLKQGPAQERADRSAARSHRGPDTNGKRQFLGVVESDPHNGNRGRHHGGTANSKQCTRSNQHIGTGGKCSDHRGQAKQNHAADEDHPMTQTVT